MSIYDANLALNPTISDTVNHMTPREGTLASFVRDQAAIFRSAFGPTYPFNDHFDHFDEYNVTERHSLALTKSPFKSYRSPTTD